ncbi:transposase, partial [Streptomyces sp. NPDC005799]|uniref:transposase n=1 Tax=Streptomyces sp. NPDC005799 TaxID=3154678 RepID=UPI0033F26533
MAGGDLTDEQWTALELLLPRGKKSGRPPVWSRRHLIDGIRFRVHTGVSPEGTCPPSTGRGLECMTCSAAGSGSWKGAHEQSRLGRAHRLLRRDGGDRRLVAQAG